MMESRDDDAAESAEAEHANGDSRNAENGEGDDDDESLFDDDEEEEAEKCFKLASPHKMFIGQPGVSKASTSLTGMEFNPPTQTLMLTTKTVIGDSVTYAVSQLSTDTSSGKQQPPPATRSGGRSSGLATLRTRRYRASLQHHGDLRLASCGVGSPGELVCAGSDRAGARHGVFRLQALTATSQPVLAQCCGPPGDRLGQFNRPAGCAVDSGCVYVADRLNHRVQRLALPTLAPLAALRHARMTRPSLLAVFADRHHGLRLLLAAHEFGVVAFDLTVAATAAATATATAEFEFARGRAKRWGGLCVHWGAVLLADQAENCVRVYRFRPDMAGGGFSLVQRLPLAPLGLCLPRGLTTHRWLDLLFVAAHDTTAAGGDVCVLTAQLARADGGDGCSWGPASDVEEEDEEQPPPTGAAAGR